MSAFPPNWFRNEILLGLQRLQVLSLPNTPAAEIIQAVAAVWIDVLWEHLKIPEEFNEEEINRIQEAFKRLLKGERYPTPNDFINSLPPKIHTQKTCELCDENGLVTLQYQNGNCIVAKCLHDEKKMLDFEKKIGAVRLKKSAQCHLPNVAKNNSFLQKISLKKIPKES